MAKLSLRAYIREIENMIDRGDLQSAQLHCKHILNIFPKCIDAYRLLGKSHIEAKQFSEAEDIFQRVLASIPDDFISHVCMSMVREEADNLDAAIWHMERAYEMQPSYLDVMNEIKRLYGKRDGVEPPKVKLTRGALVRMYTRTKLFPQAIAECRTALSEEPGRVDLEVMLASLYYQSSQKVEATELCTKILSTHPYCFEANRILSEILPSTTRAEEAEPLKNRIIELNPYCAHLSQNIKTPDLVPENAVLLERFEDALRATPVSLDADFNKIPSIDDQTPDWMKPFADKKDETITVASDNIEKQEGQSSEEPIPDWMKAAGWSESTGSAEESEQPFSQGESDNSSAEPADIPDWLNEIGASTSEEKDAPALSGSASPFETPAATVNNGKNDDQLPDWLTLEDYIEEKPANPTKILSEEKTHIDEAPTSEVQQAIENEPIQNQSIPDWLKDLEPEDTAHIVEQQASPGDEKQNTLPVQQNAVDKIPTDWLEESSATPTTGRTAPLLPDEELPSWLKDVEITPEGNEELKEISTPSEIPSPSDIPDWLKELSQSNHEGQIMAEDNQPTEPQVEIGQTEEAKTEEIQDTPTTINQDNLNSWLSSLNKENSSIDQKTEDEQKSQSAPSNDIAAELAASKLHDDGGMQETKTAVDKREIVGEKLQVNQPKSQVDEKNFEAYQKFKELLSKQDFSNLNKEINKLLRSNKLVDELLAELQAYAQKNHEIPIVWQMIGDVYTKKNELHSALDAYNKAEQLLL